MEKKLEGFLSSIEEIDERIKFMDEVQLKEMLELARKLESSTTSECWERREKEHWIYRDSV